MSLQEAIAALVKELNYLYLHALPPDDQRIKNIVDALDDLSDFALKQDLDEDSAQIKDAITALTSATAAAVSGVNDLTKVGTAITTAVQVVKVLDQALNYAGKFI
jgi:hypothetical protein